MSDKPITRCSVEGTDRTLADAAFHLLKPDNKGMDPPENKRQIAGVLATLSLAPDLRRCADALERIADLLELDDIKKQYTTETKETTTDG